MSFGGSQLSGNISSSSFVNIFHESEYIDIKKNKSKIRRIYFLLLLLFLFVQGFPEAKYEHWGFTYMGLGLAHI